MADPSDEQVNIIDAPLEPMCVVACAGSGKTKTAVQRLSKIREYISHSRSHIALLSFSNVAVNTFRDAFSKDTTYTFNDGMQKRGVTIDTFDGFITSNIMRPHAFRSMGCKQAPFLLTGSERFLENKRFKFWYKTSNNQDLPVQSNKLNDVVVNFDSGNFSFSYRYNDIKYDINNGFDVLKNLAELGAYTHEFGKFWSLYTLNDQPGILKVLANRYSHIVVDEAQDIGALHQEILKLLIKQGVKVSLIGDPNQAIYEFAGANGQFITTFNNDTANESYDLTYNYRSIPDVLNVANLISGRSDKADRDSMNDEHGAYYAAYDSNNHKQLVESFVNKLKTTGLSVNNSAVLYRGKSGIEKLQVMSKDVGQGKVKLLALAAIYRDANSDYQKAFSLVTNCIVGLLESTPKDLAAMIINPSRYPEAREIRKDIWLFLRSVDEGLPSAHLKAKSEWHGLVKERIIKLLDAIEVRYGYSKVETIGNKLAKTGLVDKPLMLTPELGIGDRLDIRVDTVHQAKGESLDAVLYMAQKSHIEAMLDGVNTEVGRIGYVAVTRARNLFLLGVPKNSIKELAPRLKALGLSEL